MKKNQVVSHVWIIACLSFFTSCKEDEQEISFPTEPDLSLTNQSYYYLDLNDRSEDRFKVWLTVDGLTDQNNIYHFPAVVPGTYRISDFGRFVRSFTAYNALKEPIATEQLTTNQWRLSEPESIRYIHYEIAETWDTPVEAFPIYDMGGTSLENDHTLINTFGVFGYLEGRKEDEFYVELAYPESWTIGTSLERRNTNLYSAEDYDSFADAPILAGELTKSTLSIDATAIGVYSYSLNGGMSSDNLLSAINQVMYDAQAFLEQLPVDRYNYLFLFENSHSGALEHSLSSVYVLKDGNLTESYGNLLKGIAAHEFFHIVTPLNIRSTIIENFNFVQPTPSQHLWFYEGVTEWASDMMQYRNGSMTTERLMGELQNKFLNHKGYINTFNPILSLSNMSLESYTVEGNKQFGNVYSNGALVAALLDIRLLELSEGKYGLRELVLELISEYGADRPFEDDDFFNIIVDKTYPEIADFIDSYIVGTDTLPLVDYFSKVGIEFIESEDGKFRQMLVPQPEQKALFESWSRNL